jgi:ADP-heptose:LPS heptosyltransferase
MRRALVIHPGALGDVLLAVPALRGLRAAAPEATVVVAAQPRLARLLVSLGVIDEGLDVEALGLHGLFAGVLEAGGPPQIRAADRVISWFGSGDETFVRSLRAVQPTAVVASPSGGVGLVWQQLRRTLGLPATGDTEAIDVPPALREAGRAALASTGWDGTSPLVVLQPGAGGEAKRWPPEGFAAVALGILGRRRASLAVHEGPADAGAGASLRARLPVPTLRLVEPTLPVLAGALAHAALYLGNDSGVSHLAAAVGAPSVILFAEAQLSWRPWATHARVVIVSRPAATVDEVAAVAAAAQAAMA